MKTENIVILGAGYTADEIVPILKNSKKNKKYKIKAILDDDKKYFKKDHRGIPIHIGLENAYKFKNCSFVFGIGSYKNKNSREKILKKTGLIKNRFPNIIDPSAKIEEGVKLGFGNIIYPYSIICSDTVLENFCILTHSTIIAHKVRIQSFTTVGSRTSVLGNTKIGKEVFIGANVLIGENLNIGDYSRIIMGTQLFKNLKRKHMAFGIPSTILKL
tara:strand:- start:1032 stop:1679 length:648 start_codon:yes stop_codon:yes gene_type:complete